jgi:hypothetical protein
MNFNEDGINEWFKITMFQETICSHVDYTIYSDILPENHLMLYYNHMQITINNAFQF